MAFGDLILVGASQDKVYRHNGTEWDGGFAVPVTETLPTGVAIDPTDGSVLIVGRTDNRVYRYADGSWNSGLAVPIGIQPEGVAIDPTTNDILVVGRATRKIYRYADGSWDAGIAIPNSEFVPTDVAVHPTNDTILILGLLNGRVYTRSSAGTWNTGLALPSAESLAYGLAVHPTSGEIAIIGQSADRVYHYRKSAWVTGVAAPTGEGQPQAITYDGHIPIRMEDDHVWRRASSMPNPSTGTPAARTVSSVTRPTPLTIRLTLSSAVAHGETVTIAYTRPNTNPLRDATGNQVATFSAQPVTNAVPAEEDE